MISPVFDLTAASAHLHVRELTDQARQHRLARRARPVAPAQIAAARPRRLSRALRSPAPSGAACCAPA
ncbi:hypothetical protein ACPPVT_05890 [Angustibacter sp. McL0619]|uniref:hypothetical protein n=1 Tax=Angustibacter sp. McL0619 TaxID=3415676 RepID=UPI003CF897D6